MKYDASSHCPLCGRVLGDRSVDQHHLVPKSKGGRFQEHVHKICHRKIHATFTNKELDTTLDTWAKLQAHPDIQTFIRWVAKKESGFYSGSDAAHRRK